jgi:hypothetical protein
MPKSAWTLIAACLLAAPIQSFAEEWPESYPRALDQLEKEQFADAVKSLEASIEQDPTPASREGGIDYLPYLHLAIAQYENGEKEDARSALAKSQEHETALNSFIGRNLWDRYALLIMATDEQVAKASQDADFREFERQPYSLSDAVCEDIKRQVLRRCALPQESGADTLPWYFHYEYGLELMAAGDAQRAVDELILAATIREKSRRKSRMYGMWFTDYLPYYQIALAHAKMGNWRHAMDAMRTSSQFGEFSPVDRGYEEYSDLQKLIMRQNEKAGS